MSLFDQITTEALTNQPELNSLRIVVEKELLHHDILRIMSEQNLLTGLTFIGGTCLRACYGSQRLSEDLDFTGGKGFSREQLSQLGALLSEEIFKKYQLKVKVDEPKKDIKNVDTWKIKVETRPEQKHLPAQRINIDICAVKSYDITPRLLLNPYGVDLGTQGLILNVESREEIFADKLLAIALRPNRVKNRDLWDISWLHQQSVTPNLALIPKKLDERSMTSSNFSALFQERLDHLINSPQCQKDFQREMQRFLPGALFSTVQSELFWQMLCNLLKDMERHIS